jgi:nucleoside-diphosphate-sugar epimerase
MESTETLKSGVLVTGATGFVGSTLVKALLKAGYPVTCMVRRTSDTRDLRKLPVRLWVGDLEKPGAAQDDLRGIRTVFHIAGAIKAVDRQEYLRVNQIGTRRLLETLAKNCPDVDRFIHLSSLAAAGPSPENRGLKEGEKQGPISWYGESKLKSEEEVLKFANAFRVTILRPSAVYGPRDRETLLMFRMIKRGFLFTPGRFTRRFSLIHVDDLSAALIGFNEHENPSGEVFFLSRPEIYTWEKVAGAIAQAMGRSYRQVAFPKKLAVLAGFTGDLWGRWSGRPATLNSQKIKELLQPSWLCDSSKAWTHLGLRPKIDLESGIRDTVRWYQEHGWL